MITTRSAFSHGMSQPSSDMPTNHTSGSSPRTPSSRQGEGGSGRKSHGTILGLRPGQLVTTQIAAALALTALTINPLWLSIVGPLVAISLILTFGRTRGRWLYQWLGHATWRIVRRNGLPIGATPKDLIDLLRPSWTITSIDVDHIPMGIIEDSCGLTSILEVGNTAALLAETKTAIPPLDALLPAADPDQPTIRVQLVISGMAAPTPNVGTTIAGTSYRQLTEGRILAQQRVLIAIHVTRSSRFTDEDLRRSLISVIRRVRRHLERSHVSCRVLAGDSTLLTLGEIAHYDSNHPVREDWSGIDLGGMRHMCYQVTRWPDLQGDLAQVFLARLLTLPGSSTTISLYVERSASSVETIEAELVIRLAAPSRNSCTESINALKTLLVATGAHGRALDGMHLDALAATLPLGGIPSGTTAALSKIIINRDKLGLNGAGLPASTDVLSALEAPVGGAGLMLGVNRHNEPVTIRMFRPEPTRAALIGSLRCAHIIVLRALAVGADVIIQSGRPAAWESFVRGVSAQTTAIITMVAPGQVLEPQPASSVRPQLLVIDVGPIGATGVPAVENAWRTTLLVREELTQADLDVIARVDLAFLQPLTPHEAYIASSAFGLGDSASWLTRIREDMVGVVVGRRTLRWALVSHTPIETQLIGSSARR